MNHSYQAILVLAILLAGPLGTASAWNSVGHMTVAKLAYDAMQKDEVLKARVDKLLGQHPHYKEFLIKGAPDGVDLAEWAFLRAATWPDWVRPNVKKGEKEDPRGQRVVKYHRGNDHFTNLVLIQPGDEKLFAGKKFLVDPDKTDIVCALKQRLDDLLTKTAAEEDKAVALCWLLHLVGDIHQPLHCTALFSSVFDKGDQGGNLYAIRIGGKGNKLHTYWDGLLGEDDYQRDDPQQNQKRYELVQKAVGTLRGKDFQHEQFQQELKNTSFASWTLESYDLAKKYAYGNMKGPQVKAPFKGPIPKDAENIDGPYDQKAHEVANRQVALAGYRLADQLAQLKKYLKD